MATLFRGSYLSEAEIIDVICGYYSSICLDQNELDKVLCFVRSHINYSLPAGMLWTPETSEVIGNALLYDGKNDMNENDFRMLFDNLLTDALEISEILI